MRFGLGFVATVAIFATSQAGAAVIFSGTLMPEDGFATFYDEKLFQAVGVAQKNRIKFNISSGVITEAAIDLYSRFAYDEFSHDYPGNSGNDYYTNDSCYFNSPNPDGCFATHAWDEFNRGSTYLSGLSAAQRSLTFDISQPRQFNDCGPGVFGRCSFYWSGSLSSNVKIASYRPVHYTLSIDTRNAVPEPATWAIMIVGFGAVGAMARRSKARLSIT